MASLDKNLSSYSLVNLKNVSEKKFGIVMSEWNNSVTESLLEGVLHTLLSHGVQKEYICTVQVPGSFELSLGAQRMAKKEEIDAVICLGCVIQGETRHFEFICNAVAHGLTQVSLKYEKPVVFGVLTTDTYQQALDRAGGKHGNKGDEAAITAIKMIFSE
jgi:6,7-dimethyl-8-ribityllumazine synthase